MKIIEYFKSDRQEHWLNEMGKSDWNGGKFLYSLIKNGEIGNSLGEKTKVLMLVEGDELISFCTYAERDDIQPTDLTPWVGFVYTFPERRGRHYFGILFDEIEKLAKAENIGCVYISTNHIGLYEKYGCELYGIMKDIGGEDSRVYIKRF